jgi:hypothetical protein
LAATLKRGVADQAQRFEAWQAFGRAGPAQLRRATFVLAEVPIAAVRGHLERREPPPLLVDELVTTTYRAIVRSHHLRAGRRSIVRSEVLSGRR